MENWRFLTAEAPVMQCFMNTSLCKQTVGRLTMTAICIETDSLGKVEVPSDKLWGAQTQRSLEHFSIGNDLIPREMILSYAVLKKTAAIVNHQVGRLGDEQKHFICQVCDEILSGQHPDQFPLHVWMTGSGTQFNMNVNELISNRCCQLTGNSLGSKIPVHPNDHVNMSQSSVETAMTYETNLNGKRGIELLHNPSLNRVFTIH